MLEKLQDEVGGRRIRRWLLLLEGRVKEDISDGMLDEGGGKERLGQGNPRSGGDAERDTEHAPNPMIL
jgi:hypothetical protein